MRFLVVLAAGVSAVSAAALPQTGPAPTPLSQCNTGNVQCCSSVTTASDPDTALLLGALGVVLQGVDVPVGLKCTPISVVELDQGVNCAQLPVCCTGSSFGGLITIGCTPTSP